jgi:hypothetical protein
MLLARWSAPSGLARRRARVHIHTLLLKPPKRNPHVDVL